MADTGISGLMLSSISVQEVRAHIEKLSVDIDRQKEVLKQLQQCKSAAQRQLNSIFDPVARLPLEISSDIFIRCLPPIPKPGASHVPMLLLNICNTWTDIALSTPALWASIHIDFPRVDGFTKVFGMWLERARDRSLSISLHKSFDISVDALVWKHAYHIKNLAIHSDQDDLSLSTGTGLFPLLETLTIGGLRDDSIGVGLRDDTDDLPLFDCHQILDILHLAPNLVECTFNKFFTYDRPIAEIPVHLSLQHLRFADAADHPESNSILNYITLPTLQTLTLPIDNHSGPGVISFFERSSPQLHDLVLVTHHPVDFIQVERCLRLLPTLTTFEFHAPRTLVNMLFIALAESPSGFLPNLRSMKIRDHMLLRSVPPSYETLLQALSGRRTKILHFELSSDDLQKPEAAALAAFQQLVADGMKIHIGTAYNNFIS
ncbi:hypothetical protein C8R44DRAFT_808579 [Mycena epipterygia]|nr:hypothetical protein C8R44DRAFT_808579 [Mycena epipterygia]